MDFTCKTLGEARILITRLRADPVTKRRFPVEFWGAIIALLKTHSLAEVCRELKLEIAYLREKMERQNSPDSFPSFREIPITIPQGEKMQIELFSRSGLRAKIQGSAPCLMSVIQLFRG